jgi:predicted lipoprotein with Yx(FWY)xxD motif
MLRKNLRVGAALAMASVITVFLGACSSGDDDGERALPTSPPPSQTQSAASLATREGAITPLSGVTAVTGSTTVLIATSTNGPFLTDSAGFTLYTSINDIPDSGVTACVRSCSQLWPPLVVDAGAPTGPAGLTGPLATFERSDDQRLHVTYKGQPLYRFNQDTAPGESKGNGFGNGVWLVAVP